MAEHEKNKADQLAIEHWGYVQSMLRAHDFEEDYVCTIGFHYKTAMIHGYKHGQEDAKA